MIESFFWKAFRDWWGGCWYEAMARRREGNIFCLRLQSLSKWLEIYTLNKESSGNNVNRWDLSRRSITILASWVW